MWYRRPGKRNWNVESDPVKLLYGSHDWAKESDKLRTQSLLKLDRFLTIKKSVHFSFLENTEEVSKIIRL